MTENKKSNWELADIIGIRITEILERCEYWEVPVDTIKDLCLEAKNYVNQLKSQLMKGE
jgi:hypothetical protein